MRRSAFVPATLPPKNEVYQSQGTCIDYHIILTRQVNKSVDNLWVICVLLYQTTEGQRDAGRNLTASLRDAVLVSVLHSREHQQQGAGF